MSKSRIYFSHSYSMADLAVNEHLWAALMNVGFYAWIDSGREAVQPGAALQASGMRRRPMDISFNEWMMSQCDGFVLVTPYGRRSRYQELEYRLASRMGLPRLVIRQTGSDMDTSDDHSFEVLANWQDFWDEAKQEEIRKRVAGFKDSVDKYRAAADVLGAVGRWQRRGNPGSLNVALLQPHSLDGEWALLQQYLQREDGARWSLLLPSNMASESELLRERFDLLVVDVGPRGTPREMLGYIHALGLPQIRICRIQNSKEADELGRYLTSEVPIGERLMFQQDRSSEAPRITLPRFVERLKLDSDMEPVKFWSAVDDVATKILETTQRITLFRKALPPDQGGITYAINSHDAAKRYFDQSFARVDRGYVYLSFAGDGQAPLFAARLAKILRFLQIRCFHYRDEDSHINDGRLESGEEIRAGIEARVDDAELVVYLVEDPFANSTYCMQELAQGLTRWKQGQSDLLAYSLGKLDNYPGDLEPLNVFAFAETDWCHRNVVEKVVGDIERAIDLSTWAIREADRKTLREWLVARGCSDVSGVINLLSGFGLTEAELRKALRGKSDDDWLDAVLRLPESDDKSERRRKRQLVAMLLWAISVGDRAKRDFVTRWIYERRLLSWPPLVTRFDERVVVMERKNVVALPRKLTPKKMGELGEQIGKVFPDLASGQRNICVTAETGLLSMPIEWLRESRDDEPLATRRAIRWMLPDPNLRTRRTVYELIRNNECPPTTFLVGLDASGINTHEQLRQLYDVLRACYKALGWPPEFVCKQSCTSIEELEAALQASPHQVLHIAGHMGHAGLQVGDGVLASDRVAGALRESDVRLVLLNGCEAGLPSSELAQDYLTFADRLIRDARVPEIVAHRGKINEADAAGFAREFYRSFFNKTDGFEPARATREARKTGSRELLYWPVVISQRKPSPDEAF